MQVEPTCHFVVGKDEDSLDSLCRSATAVIGQMRTKTAYTGRMEVHFRQRSRYGTAEPPILPIPSGETLFDQSTTRYSADTEGRVADCAIKSFGESASEPGVQPCSSHMPFYDRSLPGDPGGILRVAEDYQYAFRTLPGTAPGK